MGASNVEDILHNILDGTTEYKKPFSRVEILLVQIKDLIAQLQGAVNLKGETTTPLTDNATTNPIMIDGESYTAVMNDAVIYQSGEFIFDGTKWHELGDISNLTAANIGAMTGYAKAATGSAIATTDTLNQAIGKVEKRVDDNENNILSVQGKVKAHSEGGTDYDVINGIRVYVSATQPTGDIPTGSLWIGG